MTSPPSLKECFKIAVVDACIRFPIIAIVCMYFVFLVKGGWYSEVSFFSELTRILTDRSVWIQMGVLWPMMFLGMVFYPYFRARKPSYIRKMERQERCKAEKETKTKADDAK